MSIFFHHNIQAVQTEKKYKIENQLDTKNYLFRSVQNRCFCQYYIDDNKKDLNELNQR